MKLLNRTIIIALVLPLLLLSSCKKDDDSSSEGPTTPPSNSSLLAGTWITTALTVDPPIEDNGTLITNYFAQLEPCTQDDIVTFNADKSYSFEEGASKCNSGDMQIIDAGTWAFNTDETIIILTSGSEISELNLSSLNSTTLVVTFVEEDAGVKYTFTQTLQKQ